MSYAVRVRALPATDRRRQDGRVLYAPEWGVGEGGDWAWEGITAWPIPSLGAAEEFARIWAAHKGMPFLGVQAA